MGRRLRVPAVLLVLLASAAGGAIEPTASVRAPLRVAVREVPPFAMRDPAGNWEGLSVELWQDVADKLDGSAPHPPAPP